MSHRKLLLGALLICVASTFLAASLTGAVPLPWRTGSPAAEARTTVLSGGLLSPLPEPPASPLAAVPGLVNFQGLLTNPGTGVPVADGNYSIRFSMWDAASGPTEVWNETQPTVAVAGGLFSVSLGSVTSLTKTVFDGDPRYLEVKVGADAAMTPRLRFTTVPYAFFAEDAGLLDGLDSADFWQQGGNSFGAPGVLGTNDAQDLSIRTNGAERLRITSAGNVGIGTTNPGLAKLAVRGESAFGGGDGSPDASVEILKNGLTDLLYLSSAPNNDGDVFTVTNMGNVGIGTASPAEPLHVIGTAFIDNSGGAHALGGNPALVVDGASSEDIARFRDSGANTRVIIDTAGYVGIRTSTPDEELDVNGNILGIPIVGMWAPNSHTSSVAAEYVKWDFQYQNTNTGYFGFTAGNDHIQIKQTGYYLVTADAVMGGLIADETTLMIIYRSNSAGVNLETLCRAFTSAGGSNANLSCTAVAFFSANERVRLYDANPASYIFGSSFRYTTIKIHRLN